jgi:hypothetical protein
MHRSQRQAEEQGQRAAHEESGRRAGPGAEGRERRSEEVECHHHQHDAEQRFDVNHPAAALGQLERECADQKERRSQPERKGGHRQRAESGALRVRDPRQNARQHRARAWRRDRATSQTEQERAFVANSAQLSEPVRDARG